MVKEVLNASETADYLGLGDATTLRMLDEGEIPATRFNREWKVPLRTLRSWLEDRAIRDAQERRKAHESEGD